MTRLRVAISPSNSPDPGEDRLAPYVYCQELRLIALRDPALGRSNALGKSDFSWRETTYRCVVDRSFQYFYLFLGTMLAIKPKTILPRKRGSLAPGVVERLGRPSQSPTL